MVFTNQPLIGQALTNPAKAYWESAERSCVSEDWIPASAGMTDFAFGSGSSGLGQWHWAQAGVHKTPSTPYISTSRLSWISACAGMPASVCGVAAILLFMAGQRLLGIQW